MTFEQALELFKNNKKDLRSSLGVTRQVVHHWKTNNKIPMMREYQIKEVLRERENIHTHSEG